MSVTTHLTTVLGVSDSIVFHAMRRFERIKTRFEVVWAAGSVDGVGILRNLSRGGAWIDAMRVRPPSGARIQVSILEEERDATVAGGDVVRRSSLGFAVEFHPDSSSEVGRLMDRLAGADAAVS